jgi:hypothetical protein
MARPDYPSVASSDEQWQQLLPQLRFGVRACFLGFGLAYALVFSLKADGLMPAHMTWLGLTLAPAALFGVLGSMFAGMLWLKHRWWLLFVPVLLLSCAVMVILNLIRLGS